MCCRAAFLNKIQSSEKAYISNMYKESQCICLKKGKPFCNRIHCDLFSTINVIVIYFIRMSTNYRRGLFMHFVTHLPFYL